jgi:hypothetical protein
MIDAEEKKGSDRSDDKIKKLKEMLKKAKMLV